MPGTLADGFERCFEVGREQDGWRPGYFVLDAGGNLHEFCDRDGCERFFGSGGQDTSGLISTYALSPEEDAVRVVEFGDGVVVEGQRGAPEDAGFRRKKSGALRCPPDRPWGEPTSTLIPGWRRRVGRTRWAGK